MKKNVLSKLLMLFAVSLFLMAFNCKKVVVNHNGKDIEVSVNALQAHLDHGDCIVWEIPSK